MLSSTTFPLSTCVKTLTVGDTKPLATPLRQQNPTQTREEISLAVKPPASWEIWQHLGQTGRMGAGAGAKGFGLGIGPRPTVGATTIRVLKGNVEGWRRGDDRGDGFDQ